jgi:hypothetical protein
MSLFPAGLWRRLTGRRPAPPAALDELARWHAAPLQREDAEKSFATLNASDRELFVYRFESGRVDLAEKPATLAIDPVTRARALKYLAFFSDVAKSLPKDFTTIIAMGMGDKVEFAPSVPVFAFQKRRGNATILAPDIDFLDFGFYENAEFIDTVAYAQKTDRSIFVGGPPVRPAAPARGAVFQGSRSRRIPAAADRADQHARSATDPGGDALLPPGTNELETAASLSVSDFHRRQWRHLLARGHCPAQQFGAAQIRVR